MGHYRGQIRKTEVTDKLIWPIMEYIGQFVLTITCCNDDLSQLCDPWFLFYGFQKDCKNIRY